MRPFAVYDALWWRSRTKAGPGAVSRVGRFGGELVGYGSGLEE